MSWIAIAFLVSIVLLEPFRVDLYMILTCPN